MKKLTTLFLFSIVIITMNSCKETKRIDKSENKDTIENSIPIHEDWEVFSTAEYSISYPKEWTINTSGADDVAFMISSPSDGEGDHFTQNVSLVIEKLDNNTDLDAYAVAAKEQLISVFTESSPELEKMKQNKQDFYKVTFAGQGAKFQQYYFVENNKAYAVGFTTGEKDFDKDIVLGKKIMNTFKLN